MMEQAYVVSLAPLAFIMRVFCSLSFFVKFLIFFGGLAKRAVDAASAFVAVSAST